MSDSTVKANALDTCSPLDAFIDLKCHSPRPSTASQDGEVAVSDSTNAEHQPPGNEARTADKDGSQLVAPRWANKAEGVWLRDRVADLLVQAEPYVYLVGPDVPDSSNQKCANFGIEDLRIIINWSQKVPGFVDLDVKDQISMLRSSYMQLHILRVAYRSLDLAGQNHFRFAELNVMSSAEAIALGWSEELAEGTSNLIRRLIEYEVDVTEFSIMMGIILTYPDAEGISDPIKIVKLQSEVLDCLRRYMDNRRPGDTKRFGKVVMLTPLIRTLSHIASERYQALIAGGFISLDDTITNLIPQGPR